MKMNRIVLLLRLPLIGLLISLAVCPVFARQLDLGEIDFPTSGSPEARRHFIQGVLLLHSFEYRDARKAFREAREAEPGFAMAYWGEAMTYTHPIWNEQDVEAAREVLNGLGNTPEERQSKAPTDREKAYLQTIEVLYGEGDKIQRDIAYAQAMRELSERYPDDLEAASFYALAILGTAQGKRDFRTYVRAGAIALEVFEKNPRHPGAAHYVIHSFDDPIHAPLGLRAARAYADIAPDAPHALHMPSHIFMALGMWEESAASNEASRAASLKQGQEGLHATWWLTYSYLQQGRYTKARELISRLEERLEETPNRSMRNHLAYMQAAYVIETRQWETPLFGSDNNTADMSPEAASCRLLAEGIRQARSGHPEAAENLLAQLRALPASEARYLDQNAYDIMAAELDALIQLAGGNGDQALALLEEAARKQEAMRYEFGPPIPVKPVHELYGEVLLQLNRPEEAREAFRKALSRDPRRALSLLGLARAAAVANDPQASRKAYASLDKIWHRADMDIPGLEEISRYLKGSGF